MVMTSPLRPDFERRDWTIEEVRALPDEGRRYEVVDGELLETPTPSWLHQRAVGDLVFQLHPYARNCSLECLMARAEVTFSASRSVEPDVFVIPTINGRGAERFEDVGRLILAVEVVSPVTARVDHHQKRALYQSQAVPEYWIVDPAARFVERWRPGDVEPEIVVDSLMWQPDAEREPLVIDLAAYFRGVHGE